MKILFVTLDSLYMYPFIFTYLKKMGPAYKSLAFPILASLTPKEHVIKIVGTNIDSIPYDEKYDLVGISSMTPEAIKAYEIADEFKKRGNYVVMGGWHPSALPYEAKQHADTVVIGEAEDTWPRLLMDVQKNQAKQFYVQEKPVDLKLIPKFRRDIYPKNTNLEIIASRGCTNTCEFCTIAGQPIRKIYRTRTIESVIEDIKLNPRKNFLFHDDSLTVNTSYTKQLFKEMIGLNKKFTAYGNINVLGQDEELLKLANEAGCVGWYTGFETVSQETLNSIGKKTNKVSEYADSIKKIHDYGMVIIGSFVFGFDTDDKDIFSKTDDFISKSEIDAPYPNILTPFPGSALYKKLDKQGRILTKDWSKYNLKNVVFKPKQMTPQELCNSVEEINKRWFKTSKMITRFINTSRYGIIHSKIVLFNNFYTKAKKFNY